MSVLKKENWLICFILMIVSLGTFSHVIAYGLNLYDKNAWYFKWQYWVFGFACLIFPALIFFIVFCVQILVEVAKKFEVPGSELYASPYFWVLCIVVPFVGWTVMITMFIYLIMWPAFMVEKGNTQKYIV